jgi:tRNA pseudouridine55 synthase
MGVNGILNVNKPGDCTSFSIVARIRRITGEKRVGHAGTLDPAASGVLPICLGQATRITEYLHAFTKQYVADIELGVSTDTFDGQGRVISCKDASGVALSSLQHALESFQGIIDQVPPVYSAIKIKGRQSYSLAREGIKISLQARQVRIERLEMLAFEPPYLKLSILCSKGTYIRSLANDLGERLGCGAYLKALIRTAYGQFTIHDSHSPEEIQSAMENDKLQSLLYPADYPLFDWQKLVLDEKTAYEVLQGTDIAPAAADPPARPLCRAYDPAGRFIAIMKFRPEIGLWHPEKVFRV